MNIENKIGYLERFADNNIEILPDEWENTYTRNFGINWKLHDFQEKALKNAMVVLYYYFHKDNKKNEVNRELYRHFKDLQKKDKDDINKTFESYKNNIIRELQKDFDFMPVTGNTIHPLFFNQMCFWMATGSGKTLVIIKMIEILANLIKINAIPSKDILISSANDSIIKQIADHIKTYNIGSDIDIEFIPLKKFDKRKNELGFNKLKVYYTTSSALSHEDQVSKKKKDGKRIDYESVYNCGNWYVFLDEAHKGTEDSKTQAYFQLLSSNGFLFNFSATFTEPVRKLGTVYNMNLDKFITSGYGKQIKVIGQGFDTKSEKEIDKQISILQSLILLTAQKMSKDDYLKDFYHNPLLLVFAHSINSTISKDEKTDLKDFFQVLHNIINGKINDNVFAEAKTNLLKEIRENPIEKGYTIGTQSMFLTFEFIRSIEAKHIAEYVLYNPKNSKLQSIIEFYKIGKDKSEVALKLKTADKPFALLKFTDSHKWIEEVLPNAEELKTFQGIRDFSTLNESDNPYSMLLGSRMFVEGWDSNRPNLIHFIGLGKNEENTKLVLQAIGRGVRIEPVLNQRKRNDSLSAEHKIDIKNISNTVGVFKTSEPIMLLETLFIFATDTKTMQGILISLKNEKEEKEFKLLDKHIQKTTINEKPLLIPEYDEVLDVNKKYEITQKQLDNINVFLQKHKKIFLLKNISSNNNYIVKYLEICEYLINKTDKIQIKPSHPFDKLKDESLLLHILEYFVGSVSKFKQFREIQDNDIIHYTHISVQQDTDNTYDKLVKEISRIMESKTTTEKELQELFHQGKIDIDELMKQTKELAINQEYPSQSIKKIDKHYYQPTLFSGFGYTFKNAIDVSSEIEFINKLCEFIKQGLSPEITWYYFAKINQHHDKNIYIPYVDKYNKEKHFYPDFIFWIKFKDKYKVVFIDPKGLGRTEDPLDKINGFNNMFKDKSYVFDTENRIEIELYYYNNEFNTIQEIEKHRIDDNSLNKIFT